MAAPVIGQSAALGNKPDGALGNKPDGALEIMPNGALEIMPDGAQEAKPDGALEAIPDSDIENIKPDDALEIKPDGAPEAEPDDDIDRDKISDTDNTKPDGALQIKPDGDGDMNTKPYGALDSDLDKKPAGLEISLDNVDGLTKALAVHGRVLRKQVEARKCNPKERQAMEKAKKILEPYCRPVLYNSVDNARLVSNIIPYILSIHSCHNLS